MSMEKFAQDLKQRFFQFTDTIKSFNPSKGHVEEKEPKLTTERAEKMEVHDRAASGPTRPGVPKGKSPGTG